MITRLQKYGKTPSVERFTAKIKTFHFIETTEGETWILPGKISIPRIVRYVPKEHTDQLKSADQLQQK
jgi:hypothetical protein